MSRFVCVSKKRSPVLSMVALLALAACGGGALAPDGGPPPAPGGGPATGPALRWSDPNAWPGGAVPAAQADVTIPAGRLVLLDVSPPALRSLTIEGTLRFDRRDLELTAGLVHVRGRLEVGTEAEPFRQRAVITLTGAGREVPVMGDQVIAVDRDGVLALHGEPRVTWLRLAQTAPAGATQLLLERDAGWRPGEWIAIAPTDFSADQAEERQITAVAARTVTLDRPLQFAHWGEVQAIAGVQLDQRAEVALLSRSIVIRGDDASTSAGQGGHVMGVQGSTLRVDGVELFRMGQRGVNGRYPLHWHMMGASSGQYVRRSSVWRSFNRCITVHGTHDVVLEDNVCYDHQGHGYFLEDGAETGNTLRGNLGFRTRIPAQADRLLASDGRAATFWITNPDNVVVRNVAAGSQGMGFWYALPAAPTGLSTGAPHFPRRTPLREFAGNVAHSNHQSGLHVDDGPRPDGTTEAAGHRARLDPANGSSPVVPTIFRDFVAWKHRSNAVWLRGGDHVLRDVVLADNRIGATFASSETFLERAVVIGATANNAAPLTSGIQMGFELYDGRVGADDVTFVNFRSAGGLASGAVGVKLNNSFSMDPANFAARARFVDANPVYAQQPDADRDGNKMSVLLDSTGAVTGTAGRVVVANHPFLRTEACTARGEWNAWVCPHRYANLAIRSADATESVNPVTLVRDDDVAVTMVGIGNRVGVTTGTRAHAVLVTGRRYRVRWDGAVPTRPVFQMQRIAQGEQFYLAVPFPDRPFVVQRNYNTSSPLPRVTSMAALEASAGDRVFYDAATQTLHLKVVATSSAAYANQYAVVPQ